MGPPIETSIGPLAIARTVVESTGEIDVELVDLSTGDTIVVTDPGVTREDDPIVVHDGYVAAPALGDPERVIAYEGLRYEWDGKRPYATGDPVAMEWGPATNRGLYGSGYVGLLAGIIGRTNDEKILQLDCLATDFYRPPAYPTYLVYNPYDEKSGVPTN